MVLFGQPFQHKAAFVCAFRHAPYPVQCWLPEQQPPSPVRGHLSCHARRCNVTTIGNILQATVRVRGVRPLLWHKFGPEAIPTEKRERSGVAGNDPQEWRKTVLFTGSGQLYIEASYIFGALREGARYTPKGRGSIQKLVAATLLVLTDPILIEERVIPGFNGGLPDNLPTDPTLPVYLDVRSVRNPQTGGRNVRYRVAAAPDWRCSFQIAWDKTVVDRNQMAAVAHDAGRLVGLGDGRAIGFGRFSVESFDIEEE